MSKIYKYKHSRRAGALSNKTFSVLSLSLAMLNFELKSVDGKIVRFVDVVDDDWIMKLMSDERRSED